MDDIYVYAVDMPDGVSEAVTPCDGGYTVYVNRKLSRRRAIKAVSHAISHVAHNDWAKESVQDIERESHERSENGLSVFKIQLIVPD